MNFCAGTYRAVESLKTIWASYARIISTLWNACSAQSCSWWCLCCNKWLCWLVVIALAIIYAALLVLASVIIVLVVPLCYFVCLILVILLAIGRSPTPNCFMDDVAPPPPPPPDPLPTIAITAPPDNSTFTDGAVTPITFSATVTNADGSVVPTPAVAWWERVNTPVAVPGAPTIPLGNGATISHTLIQTQQDKTAGRTSRNDVTAGFFLPDGRSVTAEVTVQVGTEDPPIGPI
jgi:hypothetical protein